MYIRQFLPQKFKVPRETERPDGITRRGWSAFVVQLRLELYHYLVSLRRSSAHASQELADSTTLLEEFAERKDRGHMVSKFTNICIAVVLAAAMCLLCPQVVSAQVTTADAVGTVTDTTGAVLPGVTVTITNLGRA